jgi:hypothetical protein
MQHRRCLWTLVCLGLLPLASAPALPQLDAYAVPHRFALPTAVTTRTLGMGGFVTCVPDAFFSNPAFAGTLTSPGAMGRATFTNFDSGLDLRGEQVAVTWPLTSDRQGLQLTGYRLRTRNAGPMLTPAGPVLTSLREDDLAVHYGRRLDRRWVAGVGLSPVLRTETDLRHPLTGDLLAHLESKAKSGARLGGIYQFSSEGCAGLVFDYYREDVTGSGLAFGAGASAKFISRELLVGVSRRLADKVIGAVEWQQITGSGAGTRQGDSGWRAGIEVQPNPTWALRLGDNDGAFSGGVGWQTGAWSLQYAYVQNLNSDFVEARLGDSNTHSLEARFTW